MRTVLAIDVGGSQYRLALISKKGEITFHHRGKTQREQGAIWLIPRLIEEIEQIKSSGYNPLAIGVGFGGPVNYKAQQILASLHAPGWDQNNLSEILSAHFNLPVTIDNDGNVGALGEYHFGAGQGVKNMLYYTVSTGVGGGVILNGESWRGHHSQGAELGHLPVVFNGPICTCGYRGCVESICSGLSIARQALEAVENTQIPTSLRAILNKTGDLTAKDVFSCYYEGDKVAQQIIDYVKRVFVSGLIGAINLFDPEVIVIGGGVGLAPGFVDGLTEQVNEQIMIPGRRQIPCVRGTLGDNSVLFGAAKLAWNSLGME